MTLWGVSAFAQTSNPPPPNNPALHRAPVSASWTIQYTYKDGEEKGGSSAPPKVPSERLQTVTVTKSGKTYWEQSLWTSGKKGEKWIIDGMQFEILPGRDEIALVPKPDAENQDLPYFDYSDIDFPELKGLSLEHYKEVQVYKGKPAYLFEWEKSGEAYTAILSDTQLPLFFSSKGKTQTKAQTYTFSADPPARLVPPEKYLKVIQTHKRGLEALQNHPSPP